MSELFRVFPPGEAFAALAAHVSPVDGMESVAVTGALGRIVAAPVAATETLPGFARSTMDGFAVRAADTFGASDTAPAYLRLEGEVRMGTLARDAVRAGATLRVHTGAMLPPDADAVVMMEQTTLRGDELEVLRAAAPGEHTVPAGADVRAGESVFEPGDALRAQDLGALHALGLTTIRVRRRPVVGILATGDELVAPEDRPKLGGVRDVNSITVAATVERAGGVARLFGIVADDPAVLERRAREALAACDALVLSAGSSVSARDHTAAAIARLGAPGLLVHGIALRPGKPTILAMCDGKPVIGLPGNPVSALVVAWRIVRPLVRLLAGARVAADGLPQAANRDDGAALEARLTTAVPSRPGREDYVPVRLGSDAAGATALPVFGESGLIFTLVRADGLAVVPFDRAGLPAGENVRVIVP